MRRGAARVQLILPATQVFITRTRLPGSAGRHGSKVLSYALEDQTLGDPDESEISWLGKTDSTPGASDVLAVANKAQLSRWITALDASRSEEHTSELQSH